MFFYQHTSGKMPLGTKIALIAGIVLSLGFLAIFAFTFFLVALASGVVLFVIGLFKKPSAQVNYDVPPTVHTYRQNRKDDDVIDI